MCYYIFPIQPKTGETEVLSCPTVCNLKEEDLWDPKVKAYMEELDLSIKNCSGTEAI